LLLFTVLLIVLGGCAKPPTAEMEAAEAAFLRAENDPDAVAYAEPSLRRARTALSMMRTEAEAKRYDTAKSYAAEVVAAAEKAVSDGRTGALRAREEAMSLAANLKSSLRDTENALEKARALDGMDLDFNALDRDLDSARRTVAETENAIAANNPQEALTKGRAAQSALGDIMTRISNGVRIVTRKK
jgi:hypothetical protein